MRLPKAPEPGRPKAACTTALGNWGDGNEQKFLKTTTDGRRTTTTKSDTILRCDSRNFFIFLQFQFFFVYVFFKVFFEFFFNEFDCKNLKIFSHFCRLKTIMKWSKLFLHSKVTQNCFGIKTTGPSAFGVNIIKRTTLKINFLH